MTNEPLSGRIEFLMLSTEPMLLPSSAMATTHRETLSPRYNHIQTDDIVSALIDADNSWRIVPKLTWQRKANKGIQDHAAHVVTLRNDNLIVTDPRDTGRPLSYDLRIVNSHNGTTALQFIFGLFAQVCSNGLCISIGNESVFRRKHINAGGSTFGTVEANAVIADMLKTMALTPDIIDAMHNRILEPMESRALALSALSLRQPNIGASERIEEVITSTLEPLRAYDDNQTLWSTYNNLQARVIGGGVRIGARNSRAIVSGLRNTSTNLALWNNARALLN